MQPASAQPESTQPDIFVGGAMRSGTTLVHRLLCTAPGMNDFVAEAHLLRELLALYKRAITLGESAIEPFFPDPESCKRYFARCVDELLNAARARHNPDGPLVLKNPELTMYFPELAALQPQARFVLVVRDPRDCVASMSVVAERAATAGAAPPMPDMADGTKGIATLFLKYYANVITSALMRDPERLFTIRYEDLVTNPRETIIRLSLWSGLNIDADAIERPDAGDDVSIFGASLYGKKISDASIGGFARRLGAADVAAIVEITRSFMEFYGYEPRPAA